MLLAVVCACGFEHGVGPHDAASMDIGSGGGSDAAIDGPPDSSTARPCDTSGFSCLGGTATAMTCNGACWVTCDGAAQIQSMVDSACNAWSGKLAPIRDANDQACVEQLFSGLDSWIGFEQAANANATDTGWSWNGDGVTPAYLHWDTVNGQPNDSNGNENGAQQCAQMQIDGTWNDVDCFVTFTRFSCRR